MLKRGQHLHHSAKCAHVNENNNNLSKFTGVGIACGQSLYSYHPAYYHAFVLVDNSDERYG